MTDDPGLLNNIPKQKVGAIVKIKYEFWTCLCCKQPPKEYGYWHWGFTLDLECTGFDKTTNKPTFKSKITGKFQNWCAGSCPF